MDRRFSIVRTQNVFATSSLCRLHYTIIRTKSSIVRNEKRSCDPCGIVKMYIRNSTRKVITDCNRTKANARGLGKYTCSYIVGLRNLISLVTGNIISFLRRSPRQSYREAVGSKVSHENIASFEPLVRQPIHWVCN